ncbi:hypothetical protein KM043_015393 [Ampulex compressa]|nr:hypothetical protein KM043_015393 [Ampulex compressa]
MTLSKKIERGCMRLEAINLCESRRARKHEGIALSVARKTADKIRPVCIRRQIAQLLFENCADCEKMAAIPQGAFAAYKVRRNLERGLLISALEEREKLGKEYMFSARPPLEGWELTPLKYNSKLMNSIWGLYNRYSVHNFKKNTDAAEGVTGVFAAIWGAVNGHAPVANAITAAAATTKNPQLIRNGDSL